MEKLFISWYQNLQRGEPCKLVFESMIKISPLELCLIKQQGEIFPQMRFLV